MCHVPRVSGQQQFVHPQFQYWSSGFARATGIDFLHSIHSRNALSTVALMERGQFWSGHAKWKM
jgi:hypothetical protein